MEVGGAGEGHVQDGLQGVGSTKKKWKEEEEAESHPGMSAVSSSWGRGLLQVPVLQVAVLEGEAFLLPLTPLLVVKVDVGSLEGREGAPTVFTMVTVTTITMVTSSSSTAVKGTQSQQGCPVQRDPSSSWGRNLFEGTLREPTCSNSSVMVFGSS